jgi:diaminohydroxyphosphoribosylaminopyrimidine deaminase/5-amino-6-(5-phosphoribosylamino)uracil reductase
MGQSDDARFMSRALALARRGLYTTDPNPRVGCVLVRDGDIVGEGWHQRAGEDHAEIIAIRAAGAGADGATAYVSLEPCHHHGRTGPCSEALLLAGVRIKMAASLDGRTAMAGGESKWITGAEARRDVQRLRAQSSAILTGSGTLLADDPALTVRPAELGEDIDFEPPLRIVVDRRLRTPPDARLLGGSGGALIATRAGHGDRRRALVDAGAEILEVGDDAAGLAVLMAALAARGVNEVLVEAGATLCGALLEAELVDEIVLYMAPLLLGDGARGLFHLPGIETLAQGVKLDVVEVQAVGADWRITAKPRLL